MNASLWLDPRDHAFEPTLMKCAVTVFLGVLGFFLTGPSVHFIGSASLLYLATVSLGPYVLMLHQWVHRPVLSKNYQWLKHAMQFGVGPFFGQTPYSYWVHHMGMHHRENNSEQDLSTTRFYERDNRVHFAKYCIRFLFVGIYETWGYLSRKRSLKLLAWSVRGEVVYGVILATITYFKPWPSVYAFWAPLLIARFAMIAGNWAQHAFINLEAKATPESESITCVRTRYNDTCFNDGYHIEHHRYPHAHWTDLPKVHADSLESYRENEVLVFERIDYFGIWFFLMLKDHARLASHLAPELFSDWSEEEKVTLIRSRLRPVERFRENTAADFVS